MKQALCKLVAGGLPLVGGDHRAAQLVVVRLLFPPPHLLTPRLLHDERRERDCERLAFGAASRDERQHNIVVRAPSGRITAKRRNLAVSAFLVEVAHEIVVGAVNAHRATSDFPLTTGSGTITVDAGAVHVPRTAV